MTARAIPASAFPFFHLRPFPHRSSLPTRLEDLTTDEIALSWLLLDVDTATWRKLLRIWRARREKERSSTDQTPEDPVFELLDMNWPLSEDLDLAFLHSAQLASLPLHPDFKPTMTDRARAIFTQRRNATPGSGALTDRPEPEESQPSPSAALASGSKATEPPESTLKNAKQPPLAEPNRQDSPSSLSTSNSALPSTVTSPPTPATPENLPPREAQASSLVAQGGAVSAKPPGKASRASAVDLFDLEPEAPQPIALPTLQSFEFRQVPVFDDSPDSTPEPELPDERETQQQTESFSAQLQSGVPDQTPLEEDQGRTNTVPRVGDHLSIASTPARTTEGKGQSLLDRISQARPDSPAPAAAPNFASAAMEARPPEQVPQGLVPPRITRTWSAFVVLSFVNMIPVQEVHAILTKPGIPEPVAILIRRSDPDQRFCRVFVAYLTHKERELAREGHAKTKYGFKKQKVNIAPLDKPAENLPWEWSHTTERFRRTSVDWGDALRWEPSPKRRRISSSGSHRRSFSPSRPSVPTTSSPPISYRRDRSPSPRRARSPAAPLRNFSPPPPPLRASRDRTSSDTRVEHSRFSPVRSFSRDRSRSPERPVQPRSGSGSQLSQLVPSSLVNRLHGMMLRNLPNDTTRADVIKFFPRNTFVGLALNDPFDRRYLWQSCQAQYHGSAFLLFESAPGRDRFARMYCSKKKFGRSPVSLWFDQKAPRLDEWVWPEMMEEWASKHGGPLPPIPRQSQRSRSRERSPIPPSRSRRSSSIRPLDTQVASSSSDPLRDYAPRDDFLTARLPLPTHVRPEESIEPPQQPKKKRATWSEEPEVPTYIPPEPTAQYPVHDPYAYYPPPISTADPSRFYAQPTVPTSFPPVQPQAWSDPRYLQSSAAKFGYATAPIEIKRG
ncbi:hypothetical protein JCM16303_000212 [Sporobolomyces ruberrimus]